MEDVKSKIHELRAYLNYHGHCYYVLDSPEIADCDYDAAMRELTQLENDNPQYFDKNSPTQRVGGEVVSFLESAPLDTPMLSLDNAMSPEEAVQAIQKMCAAAGLSFVDGKLDLICEPKLDGLAIENTFVDGELVASKTRGKNQVGELVTHTVRTIKTMPTCLLGGEGISKIQVRGEVIMPKSSLLKYNALAVERGHGTLKNCRSGAAGSIRQFDSKVAADRQLDFIAYSMAQFEGDESILPDSHYDLLHMFGGLGFKVNPLIKKISSINELYDYYDYILSIRDQIDYDIDGIVIKLDSRSAQDEAGFTNRAAKFAIALKLPPEEVSSEILAVEIETGRTGLIAPTAKIKPVQIGGVTVSSATLHNFDVIAAKGIAVGDHVIVYRAGDVVPAIKAKLKDGDLRTPILPPSTCPCCGSDVVKDSGKDESGGTLIFCSGGINCEAQALNALIHFASRGCMNIDNVGDGLITTLFERGVIRKYSDLYALSEHDLTSLPRMGVKSAAKAIASINSSKTTDLWRFIAALNIRGIGESNAKNLAFHFGDISSILAADLDDFCLVEDVGCIKASSLKAWVSDPINVAEVEALLAAGVVFKSAEQTGSALKGQTWVVTGTMETLKRSEVESVLRRHGAKVAGSVSGNTTAVVYGDGAGSKLDKAMQLIEQGKSISLYTEPQFLEYVSHLA